MKATSSIGSAAGTDKAFASSNAAGTAGQAAPGEGFLAMLDGMIQTLAAGQTPSGNAGDQNALPAKTDTVQADTADADTADQDAIADAAAQVADATTPSLPVLPVPANAITFSATAATAQPAKIAAADNNDADAAALTVLVAQAGMVPTAQPQDTTPVQTGDAAPAVTDTVAATATAPAVLPVAPQPVALASPNDTVAATTVEQPAAAQPAAVAADTVAAVPAAAGNADATIPNVAGKPAKTATTQQDDQANSDSQQSAILAALFAQPQAQSQAQAAAVVTTDASVKQVTTGADRAGISSVPGAGISPPLSPPLGVGNGTHSAALASEESDDEATTSSTAHPSAATSLFGIGVVGSDQQAATANSSDNDTQSDANSASTAAADQAATQVKADTIANLFIMPQASTGKTTKSSADTNDDDKTVAVGPAPTDSLTSGLTMIHQPGSLGTTGAAASTGSTAATSYTAAGSPADQVSVVIQRGITAGAQSMTIALDPLELGKVEVKLDFAKDGSVQASVTAERPETLTLLKNDHSTLTQALQNAGLTTTSNSLSFNLRDGGSSQQQQSSAGASNYRRNGSDAVDATTPITSATVQYAVSSGNGRIDVFA